MFVGDAAPSTKQTIKKKKKKAPIPTPYKGAAVKVNRVVHTRKLRGSKASKPLAQPTRNLYNPKAKLDPSEVHVITKGDQKRFVAKEKKTLADDRNKLANDQLRNASTFKRGVNNFVLGPENFREYLLKRNKKKEASK